MKLLIADDETLTREGLVSSIDWESLGITEIYQADDGVNGLQIARRHKPDIILSDVRMPRMDGIHMAMEIESFLPDASIIFMSGYSDKEYLKAAIKLKAIDYVEKPLDPEEIYTAVKNALFRLEQTMRTRRNENLYSLETSSHLALLLTMPYKEHEEQIVALTDELHIPSASAGCYVTYIVKSAPPRQNNRGVDPRGSRQGYASMNLARCPQELNSMGSNPPRMQEFYADFQKFVSRYHLCAFYIRSHVFYHVFHLMGDHAPSAVTLSEVETFLAEFFEKLGEYYISHGESVSGISHVYQSYASAVVYMQSSFFFAPGTLLDGELLAGCKKEFPKNFSPEHLIHDFSDLLMEKGEDECERFLLSLHDAFSKNAGLLPNQTKDTYYKLFNTLGGCRQKRLLSADTISMDGEENVMDALERCFSFDELHRLLTEKTRLFFQALTNYDPEDSTIFKIKEYVSRHYAKDTLSIKEISEHVYLSASYVCTYFKAQTGQTLNQYLTEYRMERAMQLLADERCQITEISSRVGYHDDNYFSKSFRKFTGLSPSKYREKILG